MVELEQLDGQRFRIRREWGLIPRAVGLFLVGIGAWIGLTPLPLGLVDWALGHIGGMDLIDNLPGILVGMVIGLPLLGVGWAMAFLRLRFEIDLAQRRITDVRDFGIWKLRNECPIEEVNKVELASSAQRGQHTTNYYVQAVVSTRKDNLTVVSEPARRENEVRDIATRLAGVLGVPLEDKISDD